MTKKEARIKYKKLRQNLSDEERDKQSCAIANQLLKLLIWDKQYYHVFLSIEEHFEVDTEYILHILAGKDKDILISKSDFENRTMTHYLLTDGTKIKKNAYHIPEPVDGIIVPDSKIDVVFVPLLAFDGKGHRVGYGKGFYDRFLSKCRPDVITIGLSFFEAEAEILDISPNDFALNYCVTPLKVYQFK
jgi:5-formyltetrahydrofolate cyclo-ligase